MSLKKLIFISTIAVIISACCGFIFISTSQADNEIGATRVPTSDFTGYGPVDRIIKLKISESEVAKDDQQPVLIKAHFSMPFDYDEDLEYKWILSENVHLKEGPITGIVNHLKGKSAKTVEISVTGFSSTENRQVVFQISGQKNGRRIFADGIISSQKENTFEDIVQHVEKIKSEKKEEN